MTTWLKRLAALGAFAFLAGCGGGDDDPVSITQTLSGDARYSVLVEAVVAADLADDLGAAGSFTVFAPTNEAFTALLSELGVTKAELLANKPLLTQVLTYHVLPSAVRKAQVPAGKPITTLEGGIFKVDAVGSDLVITDERNRTAKITSTDRAASNGVIHTIDKVILPGDKTVVDVAAATPDFSILVEAVTAAGLGPTLSGTGPFTVFAPTDAAFAALLTELGVSKAQLLADTALLTEVLKYHVVSGRVLKADVPVGTPITTVQGATFTVGATLAITDGRSRTANITATDILARNGAIHVIDKVILPPVAP